MNYSNYARIVLLTALAVLLPSVVRAQADIVPPAVQSLSIAPSSIDIRYGPQTITVTLRVTDDVAGFAGGVVGFTSPSGDLTYYSNYFYPPEGHPLDGVYQAQVQIPQYAQEGTYHLTTVFVYDAVGHSRGYSEEQLIAGRFLTTVDVTSIADAAAPLLSGGSSSPATMNVSNGPQAVTFTLDITDDLSGCAGGVVGVLSPSGQLTYYSNYFYPPQGPALNGEYQAQVQIPQFGEEGIYRLTSVFVYDAAGNYRSYGENDLQGLVVPTTFTVESLPTDAAPPLVTGVAIDLTTINVSAAARTVTVTLHVTDDVAGFAGGVVGFTSPYGDLTYYSNYFYPPQGPALSGEYQGEVQIPQHAEEGVYHLTTVFVYDAVGHSRGYGEQDLVPIAPTTTFRVVYNEPPVAEAGINRTVVVGEAVRFDGSASTDPDGTVVAWQWHFGDGTTGEGALVTHAYSAAGSFVVTLTVTDDQGATAADTATVTVQTPVQAISSLSALIAADNIKSGVASALNDKLKNVLASLQAANAKLRQDAPNKLSAFINAVEAQRGKGITSAQADELEALARRILATL